MDRATALAFSPDGRLLVATTGPGLLVWDVNSGQLAWRTFTVPAPGEPGSETWKDKHNAWRIGGASVWQTASFDPDTNLIYYGTGDAFPTYDPEFRPGDNLYTASTLAFDADTGQVLWETIVAGMVMNSTISYAVNGKQYMMVFTGEGQSVTAGPLGITRTSMPRAVRLSIPALRAPVFSRTRVHATARKHGSATRLNRSSNR